MSRNSTPGGKCNVTFPEITPTCHLGKLSRHSWQGSSEILILSTMCTPCKQRLHKLWTGKPVLHVHATSSHCSSSHRGGRLLRQLFHAEHHSLSGEDQQTCNCSSKLIGKQTQRCSFYHFGTTWEQSHLSPDLSAWLWSWLLVWLQIKQSSLKALISSLPLGQIKQHNLWTSTEWPKVGREKKHKCCIAMQHSLWGIEGKDETVHVHAHACKCRWRKRDSSW